MRGFIFVLCVILYAGLGTFVAGVLYPNEEDVWVRGIFWPLILMLTAPIWIIHTCEMTGQAIGKFFRQFVRKGDKRDERL